MNKCLVRDVRTCSIITLSLKMILEVIATHRISWRKFGKVGNTCFYIFRLFAQ